MPKQGFPRHGRKKKNTYDIYSMAGGKNKKISVGGKRVFLRQMNNDVLFEPKK
jgi:hypothetical protein